MEDVIGVFEVLDFILFFGWVGLSWAEFKVSLIWLGSV